VACQSGYTFDFTKYQCVLTQTSTTNATTNTTVTINPSICAENNTFFDGSKCVSCYLPKYWNLDNGRC